MKISKHTAEHYVWGVGCDGWLLENETDRSIIHERIPSGTGEARHYHEKAKQFFLVLSGEATMEVEGEKVLLQAHEGITIWPGARHQVWNNSSADVELLVISTPTTKGDRFPA